jgi:hypothetical protein
MAIWRVIRLDDTGNRYVMAERDSQDEAQRIVDDFIARGHKQAYWVERATEDGPGNGRTAAARDH